MYKNILSLSAILYAVIHFLILSTDINACTGICLKAKDGGIAYGRTMEWGTFDLNSRVTIIPVGYKFQGNTPDGQNGKMYNSKYGIVALDMIGKQYIADGMNEKGLAIGLFYLPGFTTYPEYNKSKASNTISAQDVCGYILSQFKDVNEVKEGMQKVEVVGVVEGVLGIPIFGHWMVTDVTGKSIVIEYVNSELKIFDAPLHVITNAPNYDWHITNIQNFVNLSMYSVPAKQLSGMEFKPTGAGSGLLGLPGDNTPPSRFIRAITWTQTARTLENASDGVYETFRILDNFQLPLGPDAAEGHGGGENIDLMRSSTIWTTAWNLTDLTLNYHTQHNRRVRQLDLKKIDFSKMGNEIIYIQLDDVKEQDIKDITPAF